MKGGKRWIIMGATAGGQTPLTDGPQPLTRLGEALPDVPPLVLQLLANRNITDPAEAAAFLEPKLNDLPAPQLLPGCAEAAERIVAAVRAKRRIVIYGDYDVDGVAGAAILWHAIRLAGGDVGYYVPHRLEEGYGLNAEALASIRADGASMVVTVDCGVTALAEAEAAKTLGLELIITDHHEPPQTLPAAACIVHPRLPGPDGQAYPNPFLCGAGVALKLAWAIGQKLSDSARVSDEFRKFLLQGVSLAALATIADVVPLIGENRVLATFGLRSIKQTGLTGLDALIDSAGLRGEKVDAYHVGFTLAPRLNAAGRMDAARQAVELFTDAAGERCQELARMLAGLNRSRQETEREIFRQAVERLAAEPEAAQRRSIVLADERWHVGVVGIVASRLVGRYHRPTVLIGVQNGLGQGSARSIDVPGRPFSICQALEECADLLVSFGGHAMAGGLKLKTENIPAFAEAFEAVAKARLREDDLRQTLRIDAAVQAEELTPAAVERVAAMAPFGMGNPQPVLACMGCRLADMPRRVGRDGQHLQFFVRSGSKLFKAVAFNGAHLADPLGDAQQFDLAFEPRIDNYQGRHAVELHVKDARW